MKRSLWIFLIAFVAYLVVTFVVGIFAEFMFRRIVGGNLAMLGKRAFADTRAIEAFIESDSELHRFDSILKFTPPLGWIFLHRINGVGAAVLYASKNYALPIDQRFDEADEAHSYGFDPNKKSDSDVAEETLRVVW